MVSTVMLERHSFELMWCITTVRFCVQVGPPRSPRKSLCKSVRSDVDRARSPGAMVRRCNSVTRNTVLFLDIWHTVSLQINYFFIIGGWVPRQIHVNLTWKLCAKLSSRSHYRLLDMALDATTKLGRECGRGSGVELPSLEHKGFS